MPTSSPWLLTLLLLAAHPAAADGDGPALEPKPAESDDTPPGPVAACVALHPGPFTVTKAAGTQSHYCRQVAGPTADCDPATVMTPAAARCVFDVLFPDAAFGDHAPVLSGGIVGGHTARGEAWNGGLAWVLRARVSEDDFAIDAHTGTVIGN